MYFERFRPFKVVAFFVFSLFTLSLYAQTPSPITDNMVLGSDTNIKVIPGTYNFSDFDSNGVIVIDGVQNVVIDGDSANLKGSLYEGFGIYIKNSENVEIRNFRNLRNYKYGIRIDSSDNVSVFNCEFFLNNVDTSGIIKLDEPFDSAQGGGILVKDSRNILIDSNHCYIQNQGIHVINSTKVHVYDNLLRNLYSYGIHMDSCDSCLIDSNQIRHISRPTDNQLDHDCGILLTNNTNTLVEGNDFLTSRQGITVHDSTTSQPGFNTIRGNTFQDLFLHAIELRFARNYLLDENTMRYNTGNGIYTHYCENIAIERNTIEYMIQAGIELEQNINIRIDSNIINGNNVGIESDTSINLPGYNYDNSNYLILKNDIRLNNTGMLISAGHLMRMDSNLIQFNQVGIRHLTTPTNFSASSNTFHKNHVFEISNQSNGNIDYSGNIFNVPDTSIISCKIEDEADVPSYGAISWQPVESINVLPVNSELASDFVEYPYVWNAYSPIDGYAAQTLVLEGGAKVGSQMIQSTGFGNQWMTTQLTGDSLGFMELDLTGKDYVYFWIQTDDPIHDLGFDSVRIRFGNYCGGHIDLTGKASVLNNAKLGWRNYLVPLSGGDGWTRTETGSDPTASVQYIEFLTDIDAFYSVITLDGIEFLPVTTGIVEQSEAAMVQIGPNPANQTINVRVSSPFSENGRFQLLNLSGQLVASFPLSHKGGMISSGTFDISHLPSGMYLYQIQDKSSESLGQGKLVIVSE